MNRLTPPPFDLTPIRSTYVYTYIGAAHERGEAPQLVNMAVGLDGRAFRDLPYPPGTTIYEVDRQEVKG
jgi:O-methyltransferase involved in polyketide biosynthesis